MIKVYISSPYTTGDQVLNVRKQIDTADELMNRGYFPFTPLLSHFHHMIHPKSYGDWVQWDLAWVEACDCVLRLPGESRGADLEVSHARKHNIPVFSSIEEINDIVNKEVELFLNDKSI